MKSSRASAWKERNQVEVVFPSGAPVLMRPIDFSIFALVDAIPDTLSSYMKDVMDGKVDEDGKQIAPKEADAMENIKMAGDFIRFMKKVAVSCFVDPVVYLDDDFDDENGICADELSMEDLEFLASLINKPASELKTFSEKQETGLEPLEAISSPEEVP